MTCWLPFLTVVAGLLIPIEIEGPTIRLAEDGAIEVVGLDDATIELLTQGGDVEGLLTVAVAGAEVPMLGRVLLASDRLRFEPRYAIRAGTSYRATFRPSLLPGGTPDTPPIEADLTAPDPTADAEPTRIVAVFPTSDRLPENLLRFYVQFSSPMSRGEAYRRVMLAGPDGRPVPYPFLELAEELWDPSGTRLTLLIDPGRIKQGLVPREELGPVLEAGRRYSLHIDPDWPDAHGRPLSSPYRKTFETEPADESPPDPTDWRIEPPDARSREPIVVLLSKPLDHALLGRLLHIVDPEGRRVAGVAEVGAAETRWSFTPEAPWQPGQYQLVADTDLEDLAGNGIGRPFEVDVFDRVEPRVEVRAVTLPFRVGP